MRCTLPNFDRRMWEDGPVLEIHMGAPPRYDLEGAHGSWHRPLEDIAANGCPGAYYRTEFFRSLFNYYRQRDEHGGRVANPALDDCDDPLVHEAIHQLEAYEEAALIEYMSRRFPREE